MTVQVGIDPTGGTDPTSDVIVWSDPAVTYDQYAQYSVSALAGGDSVTVFVRSTVNKVAMNNVVYLDDAELVPAGGAEATVAVTSEIVMTPEVQATPEAAATIESLPAQPTPIEATPIEVIPFEENTPEVTEAATRSRSGTDRRSHRDDDGRSAADRSPQRSSDRHPDRGSDGGSN